MFPIKKRVFLEDIKEISLFVASNLVIPDSIYSFKGCIVKTGDGKTTIVKLKYESTDTIIYKDSKEVIFYFSYENGDDWENHKNSLMYAKEKKLIGDIEKEIKDAFKNGFKYKDPAFGELINID